MANLNFPDEGPDFLTDDTLHEAYEMEIESEKGNKVRFGELVAGKGDSITTIVIFIRHFFCIWDQDYIRSVAKQMTQQLLDTVPASARPAQVIMLGCGDSSLISSFMEETSDEFPIYTDPSGRIYEKLQMKRTMRGFTEPPPYSDHMFTTGFTHSLKQIWKHGWAGLRSGNWAQQGGEWIFQRGKLRYVHRMEEARDHLTAEQLLDILNVAHGKGDNLPSAREEGEDADGEGQEINCESRLQATEYAYIRA